MRLHGLDIARYLAFCGMVLVNFRIVADPAAGADYATLITHALEGRAAALFVVLAGIGVTLARAPIGLMLKRAAFLFAVGMVNMLIFDADILHYYAVYFLFGAAFMGASDRGLLLGAAAIMAIALAMLFTLDYERGWDWENYSYADFRTLGGFLRHTFFNGWHPVFPWAAFLVFGMWLGRKPLGEPGVQWRLVIAGSAVSALAGLPATLLDHPDLQAVFGTSPIPPGPFYVIAGAGSASAVIGATLLVTPALQRLNLAQWLAAPGRQTLTLYVAHILLGMGVMEEMGWMNGNVAPGPVFWGSLAFCAGAILYARAWARFFRRGPLETLMRLVTEPRRHNRN
jgi:uncharacterized membrane protein YeiB